MKKAIRQWAKDDRPREKLIEKGVEALSNAELIASLIGSGNKAESAVDLSKRILNDQQNNWENLGKLTVKELMQYKGIGEAKAISIIAALEIGRRRNTAKALAPKTIKSSKEAFDLLYPQLADKTQEEFWLIALRKNTIIDLELIQKGGLDHAMIDIRLLLKYLLNKNATGFIIAHNHPSGHLQPSKADKQITEKIKKAATLLDIQLLDHLIIAGKNYYSFADHHLLQEL